MSLDADKQVSYSCKFLMIQFISLLLAESGQGIEPCDVWDLQFVWPGGDIPPQGGQPTFISIA